MYQDREVYQVYDAKCVMAQTGHYRALELYSCVNKKGLSQLSFSLPFVGSFISCGNLECSSLPVTCAVVRNFAYLHSLRHQRWSPWQSCSPPDCRTSKRCAQYAQAKMAHKQPASSIFIVHLQKYTVNPYSLHDTCPIAMNLTPVFRLTRLRPID